MSIHKIQNNRYRVRWRERGRLKSKSFSRKVDADQFDAMQRAKPVLNEAMPGLAEIMAPLKKSSDQTLDPTFAEYVQMFLHDYAEVHRTPGSVIRDRQIIRDHFLAAWGRMTLPEITRRHLVTIQAELSREGSLKPKTINNVLGLAHKMFTEAERWDLIKISPARGVRTIKCPEQDYRFWTFDERDRFLSYAKAERPELYSIIAMAVNIGLRRGELEGLMRDCVDFERREIIVRRSFCHKTSRLNDYTKGKKPRRVPMNELVFQILRERALTPLSAFVLPFDYEHMLWRHFYRSQEKAGVSRIKFHDRWHTFASHMANLGVGVFQIKELLGHSDIHTTMRYMHLAPGHLQGLTDVLLSRKSLDSPQAAPAPAATIVNTCR